MSENEIRAKITVTVKKYLECKESDGSHRQFIDACNSSKLSTEESPNDIFSRELCDIRQRGRY